MHTASAETETTEQELERVRAELAASRVRIERLEDALRGMLAACEEGVTEEGWSYVVGAFEHADKLLDE